MNSVIDMSRASERKEIAPVSDSTALVGVIERAARDPSVDIVKLKELLAMRKELAMEAAEVAFNRAMIAAQTEMRPVAADAENPQTRSRYASYPQLSRALKPIYTKHGFAISYDEGDTPKAEYVRVLAYVSHNAGFTRTYRTDMPADGKGAKGGDVMTKTHAVGAGKSYGKRYLLKDIFDVAVGEDDQDGNDPEPAVSEEQIANLEALLTEVNANKSAFLKWLKVKSLGEIYARNYDFCVKSIEAKRRHG